MVCAWSKAEQDTLLPFIKDLERKVSLITQNVLASSASSARKARKLGDMKSLEQEAEEAGIRVQVLEGRIEEIENDIKELEELLKG
jgi:predicted  nucleic acid-binding Zn-ribbon protein